MLRTLGADADAVYNRLLQLHPDSASATVVEVSMRLASSIQCQRFLVANHMY